MSFMAAKRRRQTIQKVAKLDVSTSATFPARQLLEILRPIGWGEKMNNSNPPYNDRLEFYEERAGIREFAGGASTEESERGAVQDLFEDGRKQDGSGSLTRDHIGEIVEIFRKLKQWRDEGNRTERTSVPF